MVGKLENTERHQNTCIYTYTAKQKTYSLCSSKILTTLVIQNEDYISHSPLQLGIVI